jgi:hypothetical protein
LLRYVVNAEEIVASQAMLDVLAAAGFQTLKNHFDRDIYTYRALAAPSEPRSEHPLLGGVLAKRARRGDRELVAAEDTMSRADRILNLQPSAPKDRDLVFVVPPGVAYLLVRAIRATPATPGPGGN